MAKKRALMMAMTGLLIGGLGCQEEREPDGRDGGKPLVESTEVSTNFPPVGTSEVRAFSLPPGVSNFLEDGKLNPKIDRSHGVVLNGEFLEEAYVALNAPIHHEMNFMCFSPRDALIFFDNKGGVVGSVVICFTCYKTRISPRELSKNLDYGLLATVFAHPALKGGYPFEKKGVTSYISEYRELLTKAVERIATRSGRTVIPEPWSLAEPQKEVKIHPGDEVFVSATTANRFDPCNGKSKVDLGGFLKAMCCSESVKIGGMTEVEASKVIAEQFFRDQIYPSSTKVRVVNANRFPDEK